MLLPHAPETLAIRYTNLATKPLGWQAPQLITQQATIRLTLSPTCSCCVRGVGLPTYTLYTPIPFPKVRLTRLTRLNEAYPFDI
jgi:hypothetical protein